MKITRGKIESFTDRQLMELWSETSRREYAGMLVLRYIPYLYGVGLHLTGSAEKTAVTLREFAGDLPSDAARFTDADSFREWIYSAVEGRFEGVGGAGTISASLVSMLIRLDGGDKVAWEIFERDKSSLSKPQRECIELFCRRHESFESIAGHAGYLTDKIGHYLASGIAALAEPDGDRTPVSPSDPGDGKFAESFVRYVRGDRDGAHAHDIELASMTDPLLADALAGYLSVPGDHGRALAELDREVESLFFVAPKRRTWMWALAAACAIVCGVVFYVIFSRPDADVAPVPEIAIMPETPLATPSDNPQATPPDSHQPTSPESPRPTAPDTSRPTAPTGPAGEGLPVAVQPEPAAADDGVISLVYISTEERNGEKVYVSAPRIGLKRYNEYLDRAAVPLDEEVKGDVTLTFQVNRYGRPSQMRVIEYLSQEAHREAIRLLDNGPEWSATDAQVTVIFRFR